MVNSRVHPIRCINRRVLGCLTRLPWDSSHAMSRDSIRLSGRRCKGRSSGASLTISSERRLRVFVENHPMNLLFSAKI